MAASIVNMVEDKLSSLIREEIGLLCGFNKEMKKLQSNFKAIRAVLQDAELKQHLIGQEAIKDWLRKLTDAAYVVDDILDDYTTEAGRLEYSTPDWLKKVCLLMPFLTCLPFGNPWFSLKIGHRMKNIRERLDDIAKEKSDFGLSTTDVVKRVERQTGHMLTGTEVYGRDEDKEKIVEVLINHVKGDDDLLVYPIIGIGGIGKTTLAQLVYNDKRIFDSHFQPNIWVCVSEDFDVKRILKAIIESASESACDVSDLHPLQIRLQQILNGKRYLLVLDDVWNEHQGKWEELEGILKHCGEKGSSIITTTRLEMVASIMRTDPSHSYQLTELSNDDCWLLFKRRAFGSEREKQQHPELVEIGKEIVKKCAGVPLAAKTLGSLMQFKRKEVKEWVGVKDSEIWNLPQEDKNSILPALRLSYQNLPLPLRRCFAYCSVFGKDTVIEKTDIINLWMANGFISSAKGSKEMEDIGNDIWNELHLRSFFQDVKEDVESFPDYFPIVTFKVHDLMHDLGHSVMEEECQIIEVERSPNNVSEKRIRYLNLIASSASLTTMPKELQNNDSLRTLLYTERPNVDQYSKVSVFENNGKLRAFAARVDGMTKLASSICSLKHLRYLRIGSSEIETLPDSICSLWNLQTLNLDGCFMLQRLPENMRCLRKLRHLLNKVCWNLSEMPPCIGELTCLKMLGMFIVQQKKGCGLDELKCLDHLGESLSIQHLGRVKNVKDAQEANLIGKENLRSLILSWYGDTEGQHAIAEQVFQALQPSSNLKRLKIKCFYGTQFPQWMSDKSSLKNIVKMELDGCINSLQLPLLHQLPSLRYLVLEGMHKVEYIINDDNNYEAPVFPCLEELTLYYLPKLRSLLSKEEERRGPIFPCLRKLKILEGDKLTALPKCLPALETLVISRCPELTTLPKCLPALEKLVVRTNIPDNLGNFTSLQSLSIRECDELTSIPASFQNLTKLQSLEICWCPLLQQRCVEGGEEWDKIKHVPHVTIMPRTPINDEDEARVSSTNSTDFE